jgi:RNA recognition motif-containing protein
MDIYVGNLPYKADDQKLQELFSQHGTVTSARVIVDKFSGESKGFGFVEMPDKAEAEAAIRALNEQDFMGRALRVNESQPKPSGGGGGGGRDRRGGGGGGGGGRGRW